MVTTWLKKIDFFPSNESAKLVTGLMGRLVSTFSLFVVTPLKIRNGRISAFRDFLSFSGFVGSNLAVLLFTVLEFNKRITQSCLIPFSLQKRRWVRRSPSEIELRNNRIFKEMLDHIEVWQVLGVSDDFTQRYYPCKYKRNFCYGTVSHVMKYTFLRSSLMPISSARAAFAALFHQRLFLCTLCRLQQMNFGTRRVALGLLDVLC